MCGSWPRRSERMQLTALKRRSSTVVSAIRNTLRFGLGRNNRFLRRRCATGWNDKACGIGSLRSHRKSKSPLLAKPASSGAPIAVQPFE